MKQNQIILALFLISATATCWATPLKEVKRDEAERTESLDRNGKYLVSWKSNIETKTIIFQVTVQTLGFVGFGLSPNGGMAGADIVIGGINDDGTLYFTDRHALGNREPVIDDQQDWELLEATENATHTMLKFSRLWNTCDPQDVKINEDTINFIWAFGDSDYITYHTINRGTKAINVLDPPMPPFDVSEVSLWKMSNTIMMPANKTTYWCTVHKNPAVTEQHHVVGYRPLANTDEALEHTHHTIVHKCTPPPGAEEFFENLIKGPGGHCYEAYAENPIAFCITYLFVWAKGGSTVVFPDHVGYPMPNKPGTTDYFLLETHYDNPNQIAGRQFETGIELFYTPDRRQYEGDVLIISHSTTWAISIPPRTEEFMIIGHCSPGCTSNLPPGGIHVFNVGLHSHLAGRKLKLRHFRGDVELPWVASDENYNFDYQQNRPLRDEVTILPGDHLIYECTYNSMPANGAIFGGLSTEEEMCNAFIWYYPTMSLDFCDSEANREVLLDRLGIEEMAGDFFGKMPIVVAPPRLSGKTYKEVYETEIEWTAETRAQMQQQLRFGGHGERCSLPTVDNGNYTIFYPQVSEEYKPIDQCAQK